MEKNTNRAMISGLEAIKKLPNDGYEERLLMNSYFSGVYVQDNTRTSHDGRPVYIERSKFDGTEFEE